MPIRTKIKKPTKDESEEGSEAAEDDGMPLKLDLHEEDGERGRDHACKHNRKFN